MKIKLLILFLICLIQIDVSYASEGSNTNSGIDFKSIYEMAAKNNHDLLAQNQELFKLNSYLCSAYDKLFHDYINLVQASQKSPSQSSDDQSRTLRLQVANLQETNAALLKTIEDLRERLMKLSPQLKTVRHVSIMN